MRKSLPLRLSETYSRKDTARGPPPSEPSYRLRPVHRYASVYTSRAASPLLTSLPKGGIYPISHIIKEPDFRHRPISAPFAPAAGSKRPNTARDLHSAAKQEDSVQRLFKGSRATLVSFAEITENPAFKFSDLEEVGKVHEMASLQQRKESIQHRELTRSLQVFTELQFDLDFNYDLSREAASDAGEVPSGLLVTLQELAKDTSEQQQDQLIELYTRDTVGGLLKDYTQHIRTLLRCLKGRDMNSESSLLELLWKLVVKLFDSALVVHDLQLQQTLELTKYRVREEVERRRRELEALALHIEREEQNHRDQVARLNDQIKALVAAKQNLEEHLEERQIAINKLQSVTTREESVREMSQFYVKMDRFLVEAENEQEKQLNALQDISTVMEEVRKLDQKQPCANDEAQTEWTMRDCRVAIPVLSQPIFSLHPYYSIVCQAASVDKVSLVQVLEELEGLVQTEVTPDLPSQLYLRLLLKLGKDFPVLQTLACRLAGYCEVLLQSSDDPRVTIYAGLLGLTRSLPSQAELQYYYRVRQAADEIKAPEGLPLAGILEVVQQGFQNAKAQGCELLAKLQVAVARPTTASDGSLASYVHSEALAQVPAEMINVFGRLALVLEKHKKSWKNQMEALDAHKSGVIHIGQIVEHLVSLLWLSPSEVNLLSAYFDSKGTGQVRVADAVQSFDPAAFQQSAHRTFVARDLFLLRCIEVWHEAAYSGLPAELPLGDFTGYLQSIHEVVGEIEDLEIVRLYVETASGHQNWQEVLAASGCFGRFEVQEIKQKTEKRVKSKRKR